MSGSRPQLTQHRSLNPLSRHLRQRLNYSKSSLARDLSALKHAQHLLHALPRHHRFLPALELGELVNVPLRRPSLQREADAVVPHAERQVCIGTLVPHEPIPALEHVVEYAYDALELVAVAFFGAGERFRMESVEPVWMRRLD